MSYLPQGNYAQEMGGVWDSVKTFTSGALDVVKGQAAEKLQLHHLDSLTDQRKVLLPDHARDNIPVFDAAVQILGDVPDPLRRIQ